MKKNIAKNCNIIINTLNNRKKNYTFFLIVFVIFISCKENTIQDDFITETNDTIISIEKNILAEHFEIENHNGYNILRIKKPWQNADNISFEYYLVKKGQAIPESIKEKNIIITPVERIICMSTSHIAMIDTLGKINSIIGVSGKNFVNNKMIFNNAQVRDVGYEQGLNYEVIVSLNPDLVILYGVEGEIAGYQKKLNELGIKTIFNAEYLEDTPIAKVEWLKFIGALLNESELANNIFQNINKEYQELKNLTDTVSYRPKVMTGLPWKDIWYVSSGNSNLANIINDAGADFLWKNDTASDVMALDIEAVISKSIDADYWINISYSETKNDILASDSRLGMIKAFKNGKTFNNNAILNSNGGNDYFESGIMNPHLLLKDLISIFHPELLPEHKLKYYRKLE